VPNIEYEPAYLEAYPVVEETHLARLHYGCLSSTTHFMHHEGFTISVFSLPLTGSESVLFDTSRCIFLQHLQTQLSTGSRTILAPFTSVLKIRCFSLHLSQQLFAPFSISNASHVQLIMGFSLQFSHFIIKEFLILFRELVCVLFGCLCGNLNLQGHKIGWHFS